MEGDIYKLEDLMKNRRKLSKYEDENISPLHHAAAEGQIELMKMIIHGSSCEGNQVPQCGFVKTSTS